MRGDRIIKGLGSVALVLTITSCGSATPVRPAQLPTPSSPTAVEAAPTSVETTSPTSSSSASDVSLPAGRVPAEVVGRWTGGYGGKTGEYMVITSDGEYACGKADESPYRSGVIVAQSGATFTTYNVDGGREAGRWEYTNAAGIEVLGVYFGQYYYSYVRS